MEVVEQKTANCTSTRVMVMHAIPNRGQTLIISACETPDEAVETTLPHTLLVASSNERGIAVVGFACEDMWFSVEKQWDLHAMFGTWSDMHVH